MGKLLFFLAAAVASLVLVESLVCNKCSFAVMGQCMDLVNETCLTNTSVCYSEKSAFPMLPDSMGVRSLGCKDNDTGCDTIINGKLMTFTYETHITCCSTDNCNPIYVNSAPATKMTFTAAISGAILAFVWGNFL